MNKKEALEIIDNGWIRKPKGYHVRFQKKEDGRWQSVSVPDEGQDVYDSDVVAWRIAWKLSQAAAEGGELSMANIHVVDDTGEPVKYYATGDYKVYCELDI